jgi:hypothetical protein
MSILEIRPTFELDRHGHDINKETRCGILGKLIRSRIAKRIKKKITPAVIFYFIVLVNTNLRMHKIDRTPKEQNYLYCIIYVSPNLNLYYGI